MTANLFLKNNTEAKIKYNISVIYACFFFHPFQVFFSSAMPHNHAAYINIRELA